MTKRGLILIFVVMIVFAFGLSGCTNEPVTNDENKDVEVVDSKDNEKDSDLIIDSQDGNETTGHEENEISQENNNGETNENDGKEQDTNILYISASKLNVRSEPETGVNNIIGSLIKGSSVKVIEEQVNEEGQTTWFKVEFDNGESQGEGWISAEYTVKDKMELLGPEYRDLNLNPIEKAEEYPENPRVEVKGVYLTIHSAGGKRLDDLIKLANETDINTFVIDVKDDNGNMLFPTETAEKYNPEANEGATIKDIEAFMKKLKENNIYTIARIVSFKDPKLADRYPERAIVYKNNNKPFTNRDGIVWLSPYNRDTWEYNIEVSKEAAEAGFNEIQFDYVRFPASNGGKMDKYLDYRNELDESKPVAIQRYLEYAREELSPLGVYISADIYGLVGSVSDDMGIGQYWEAVSNVVDYVSPMMYPSHYGNGVYGLSVPDAYPYETIDRGARDANLRNKNIETPAIIRPWIQDFTATWVKGHIRYGDNEVKAQIKALEDNGINEYLLWNPGNKYSEGAVK